MSESDKPDKPDKPDKLDKLDRSDGSASEADEEPVNPVYKLPTEILIIIFLQLPGNALIRCCQVNTRWKSIIDELKTFERIWMNLCMKEYPSMWKRTMRKSKGGITWFCLYRSLSVWPRLADAHEEHDEFAPAHRLSDEVRSVQVVDNYRVSVHKRGRIDYYSMHTLLPTNLCHTFIGDYARYVENNYITVIQHFHLGMYLIRKYYTPVVENNNTYENVKLFLLTDTELYFAKLNNDIYVCDILKAPYKIKYVVNVEEYDGVMSLGYSDNCLNILTYERNIFTVIDQKELVFKHNLNTVPNLLDCLHKFNFLEQLDWRVYFQWMYVLKHQIPDGPLQDIIIIKPYGDVFFVGSTYGVLCIFYKPYTDGKLDLFNKQPIRQVNFMERADIPVLSTCPILQIDVVETEVGHDVYVAMPKKVAVLKYRHQFEFELEEEEEEPVIIVNSADTESTQNIIQTAAAGAASNSGLTVTISSESGTSHSALTVIISTEGVDVLPGIVSTENTDVADCSVAVLSGMNNISLYDDAVAGPSGLSHSSLHDDAEAGPSGLSSSTDDPVAGPSGLTRTNSTRPATSHYESGSESD